MASVQEIPAIWLQCSSCSGDSVSLLNAVSPSVQALLLDQLVPGTHVHLRFHPTIMAGQGEPALEILESDEVGEGFLLVIEGAIPTRHPTAYGVIGEKAGAHLGMAEKTAELAGKALAVIALGTCAAFGGIHAAEPNPTGCVGLADFLESRGITTPVVNIPGCPAHPDWFTGTVLSILLHGLPQPEDLDELKRPKVYFGGLVHEHCLRRPYFDAGKFARSLGDVGCLYELGCKGPESYADCPRRMWNSGTNWCINANSPCHGCSEPEFPDTFAPLYEKLNEAGLRQLVVGQTSNHPAESKE